MNCRQKTFLLLIPLLLLSFTQDRTAIVRRIIDGDTIVLDSGEHVLYIGIDTPEAKHPRKPVQHFGREASEANKKLVDGKPVRLEFDVQKKDRNGRLLAYVFVGSGAEEIFVNAWLVKNGYARAAKYPPNLKYKDKFLKLENEARKQSRGLWKTEDADSAKVIGNKRSKVYHKSTCGTAKRISEKNRIAFTKSEAEKADYRAAKCCHRKKKKD